MNTLAYIGSKILTVSGKRSLANICSHVTKNLPEWVIIIRSTGWSREMFYYAYHGSEIQNFFALHPEMGEACVEDALNLRETKASAASKGQAGAINRSFGVIRGAGDISEAAVTRSIALDLRGNVIAVEDGHVINEDPYTVGGTFSRPPAAAAPDKKVSDVLGSARGVSRGRARGAPAASPAPSAPAPAAKELAPVETPTTRATLSAQSPSEIKLECTELVEFRIELADEAKPLSTAMDANIETDVDIRVILSTDSNAVEIIGSRITTVGGPKPGRPAVGEFEIKAAHLGSAQLAVAFRQGGSELGAITLAVEVVEQRMNFKGTTGTAEAAPRDKADDDMLILLIEQKKDGERICYEYRLYSESLGLNFLTLQSKPLLDRGGGLAATTLQYVERIYDKVTKELHSPEDVQRLTREVKALGTNMCAELFDAEVTKQLWPLRDRIRTVQVTTWEPYIPWELVRLKHPETGEVDERFLCEYGLIRTLAGQTPPRTLPLRDWRYLGADYPNGTHPAIGRELAYFTEALPEKGIHPQAVPADYNAFYDTLAAGDFDVLHIACHGESEHQNIERSVMIIGDELGPGGQPRNVEVDGVTVEGEAKLKQRRPLIFLNACESARHGASLTGWGGWPNVFLRAGAGVFVGTSWSVRDVPASKFAQAFYDDLLAGKTLAEAAGSARAAIKAMGDASWLAFKVYGHPRARMGSGKG